jgi:uncharacterized protein YjiK
LAIENGATITRPDFAAMNNAKDASLPISGIYLMRRSAIGARALRSLVTLLLVLAVIVGGIHWMPRIMLAWHELNADQTVTEKSVWLPDYRVDIEARPLAGVENDVSGLTYDPDRGTLLAITNARSQIIELSLEGEVLRRIPVSGLGDPEAIEYVGPGRYVVADEQRQALVEIRLDADTQAVEVGRAGQLAIGMGRNGNKGFEGLAYDHASGRLFVAKERDPQRIYTVRGFPFSASTAVEISDYPVHDKALPGTDLASLHFHASSGHLLALSEESHRLVELDAQGKAVSSLSLLAGRSSGLKQRIPQAEGVAMDARGNLYVVSEPNLFYRFVRD